MISVQRVLSFVINYLHFVAVGRGEKQQENCNIIKEVDQPLCNIQHNLSHFIPILNAFRFLKCLIYFLNLLRENVQFSEGLLDSY